jgi:redox-sensing transcriptional repressor
MLQEPKQPSEATVYRLALYHCYLDDLIRREAPERITSRELAQALDLKEETVRRDISFVRSGGRPGAGYVTTRLQQSLSDYLGLNEVCPIIKVGTAEMLAAVSVVFPAADYGSRTVACFTENPADVGKVVDGLTIRHIADIPRIAPDLGAHVAIIASGQEWVQVSVDLLQQAGITGFLLLTPVAAIEHAENTVVHHIRMPCDVKSLACRCRVPVPQEFAQG